jgi:solute carrier family 25 oxoglutarate transporter 11
MYFEFDDVRRIHQPYTDAVFRAPNWKAPTYNTPYFNWRRGMYAMGYASIAMESVRHFTSHVAIMNDFYEWPKTRSEFNIFFREVFKMPDFWPEYAKKLTYGLITVAGDTAPKLAAWQYIYGGTWSPADYVDSNTFKHVVCANMAIIPTCWTGIPFEMARRAYYADKSWPLELRKGYTSPTNALIRIPFE